MTCSHGPDCSRLVCKLTHQKQLFVRAYCQHLNATQAAKDAKYSARSAESKGAKLKAEPEVAAAITEELKWLIARAEVDADFAVWAIQRAIEDGMQTVPVKGHPGTLRMLDRNAVIKGAELMLRRCGQLPEHHWHSGPNGEPISVKHISDGDLDQRIKQLLGELGYASAIDEAGRVGSAAAREAEAASRT